MKRFSKILCAILVLAMLCSSLAFMVSAESFTPTATFESTTASAHYVSTDAGNVITSAAFNNMGTEYSASKVTDSKGNSYAQLTVLTTGTKSSDNHFQWTMFGADEYDTGTAAAIVYSATSNTYAVYDMDIATETTLPQLSLNGLVRTAMNFGGSDKSAYLPENISPLIKLTAGEFAHLTVVQDYNNNKMYVYVNNNLIRTTDLLTENSTTTNHTAWVNGEIELYTGIKLQNHANYKLDLTEGETIMLDNLYCAVYQGDEAGNLSSSLSDLSAWTGNRYDSNYVLPTVPALAEIDGVEYNNVKAVNGQLSFSLSPKTVTLLRESIPNVEIECDVTLQSNGITTFNVIDGATEITNDDGTVTIDAPFVSNKASELLAMGDYADAAYPSSDNKFGTIYQNEWGESGQLIYEKVTDKLTGNVYLTERPYNEDGTVTGNSYARMHMGNNLYVPGVGQHFVLEYDLAIDDLSKTFNIAITTGVDGDVFGKGRRVVWVKMNLLFAEAGISNGEFAHFTLIGDVDDNKMYLFVNGVKMDATKFAQPYDLSTSSMGVFYAATMTDYTITSDNLGQYGFACMEWPSKNTGGNFSFANVYMNYYIDADVNLDNVNHLDGFGGDIYTADYSMTEAVSIASVDGIMYSTVSDLELALYGNVDSANKQVVLYHDPGTTVTVECTCTIETNGIADVFVAAEGVTFTEDDTVINFTAPYKESGSYEDIAMNSAPSCLFATDSTNIIKAGGGGIVNITDGDMKAQVVTNTETGDQYAQYTALITGDHGSEGGFGFSYRMTSSSHSGYLIDEENPVYELYEIDLATDSDILQLALDVASRTGGSGTGKDFGQTDHIPTTALGIESGSFYHITIINDYVANTIYYFVNNELKVTRSFLSSTNYNDVKSAGTALHPAIKIQGHSGYKYNATGEYCTKLYENDTIMMANFYGNVILGNEDATLAQAIANGDLSTWENNRYNEDYHMPTPNTLAKVDGVSYSGVDALTHALKGNFKEFKNVEFTRSTPAGTTVTVGGDCIINTNGLNVSLAYEAGSLTEIDANTVKFDADFFENYTIEKLDTTFANTSSVLFAPVAGNLLSGGNYNSNATGGWGSDDARQSYVYTNLDTGATLYYENGNIVHNGFDTTPSTTPSNEYVNIGASSYAVTKTDGKNTYGVVEFDFLLEEIDVSKNWGGIHHVMRKTSDGGNDAWGTQTQFRDIANNGYVGELIHVSIIYDYANNLAHTFVNGNYNHMQTNGCFDSKEDGTGAKEMYNAGETLYYSSIRIGSNFVDTSFYMDNLSLRVVALDENDDAIGAAIESGDLTGWSGCLYDPDEISGPAALATVDGKAYYTTSALNAALAEETEGTKNVEILHNDANNQIIVDSSAIIDTNGLDFTVTESEYQAGEYHEIDTGDANYYNDGIIKSYIKYVHIINGNVHTIELVNKDNFAGNTGMAFWVTDLDNEEAVTCIYAIGAEIVAPELVQNTVINGVCTEAAWYAFNQDTGEIGEIVTDFGTASAVTVSFAKQSNVLAELPDFILPVVAQLSINSEFVFTVTYDDKTWTFTYAANEIDKIETIEFTVTSDDGKEYACREDVSIQEYAVALFANADATELEKQVMYAALAYANESYVLLDGAANENIAGMVEAYAAYATEAVEGAVVDTTALKDVIRAAAMQLDSAPSFVLKMTRGNSGKVVISYTSLGEAVSYEFAYDATAKDQMLTINTFKAYDIHEDITITVMNESDETVATGVFNLATYADKLGDNSAFADALLTYATLAKQLKATETAD